MEHIIQQPTREELRGGIINSGERSMRAVERMLSNGLEYSILLDVKGKNIDFNDYYLPIVPPRVLAMTWDQFVMEQLDLCRSAGGCEMAYRCHICAWIPGEEHNAIKLCTVLFHDLIKPKWKLSDVV